MVGFGAAAKIEQVDALTDQAHRGFKQMPVEGDAAIFGHGMPGDDEEMVAKMFGRGAQALAYCR